MVWSRAAMLLILLFSVLFFYFVIGINVYFVISLLSHPDTNCLTVRFVFVDISIILIE